MSTSPGTSVAVLVTGLFEDGITVEAGLERIDNGNAARRIVLEPERMTDEDWDRVVKELLSATKIITV